MKNDKAAHPDCLDEAIVDQYCTGKLQGAAIEGVEAHLLVCEWCRRRVRMTDDLIRALRNRG